MESITKNELLLTQPSVSTGQNPLPHIDLVAGVKRVVVVIEHSSKDGAAKFKPYCDLPLTGH